MMITLILREIGIQGYCKNIRETQHVSMNL